MTDRMFADCCYGTAQQHLQSAPCPQARLILADVCDLAGFAEDAEHLRKPARVGEVMIPHSVAMAAMLVFAGHAQPDRRALALGKAA